MTAQVISASSGLSLLDSGVSPREQQMKWQIRQYDSGAYSAGNNRQPPAASADTGRTPLQPRWAEDRVELSSRARELSQQTPQTSPAERWQQVQAMAAQLSGNMDAAFMKAGIDTSEPIRIQIHAFTGIPFVGEHPDKVRIQNLLDNTPDLLQQIRQVNTLASYHYQISPALNAPPAAATASGYRAQQALNLYQQNQQSADLSLLYQQDLGLQLQPEQR